MAGNDDWLASTREAALEPELPICDPHHHLWEFPDNTYITSELLADVADHHVVETVFVECTSGYRNTGSEALRPVGETDYVARLADANTDEKTDMAAGIVGFADLTLGADVREVLVAHLDASARFRGIRHASAHDASDEIRVSHTKPPPELLAKKDFREGFGVLTELGLSFDAWLYHPQIPELTDLARAFPQTTIVLDHCGGPLGIGPYAGRHAEVFAAWKPNIAELATCSNVVVKVGGMTMPINGFGWHLEPKAPGSERLAETLAPWYSFIIDCFGPERCMFESNFPVDRASCSYTVLWNMFKRISTGYAPEERASLFRETARRVYRLA